MQLRNGKTTVPTSILFVLPTYMSTHVQFDLWEEFLVFYEDNPELTF